MPPPKPKGFSNIMADVRTKRQESKQPFVVLKLTVGICSALIIYVCYVYIGRLCVPMLTRSSGAMGSRGMGVAFLVVFIFFAFMMIWSYIKVVFTPPGSAREHATPSDPPLPSLPGPAPPSFSALAPPTFNVHTTTTTAPPSSSFYPNPNPPIYPTNNNGNTGHYVDPNLEEETIGIPYERMTPGGTAHENDETRRGLSSQGREKPTGTGSPPHLSWEGADEADEGIDFSNPAEEEDSDSELPRPPPLVFSRPSHSHSLSVSTAASHGPPTPPRSMSGQRNEREAERGGRGGHQLKPERPPSTRRATSDWPGPPNPKPKHERSTTNTHTHHVGETEKGWRKEDMTRKPSNVPVLLPEYRYCRRCRIVRPPRAHHCRACGTCVLKYDHHCPWIGQCVGARNHKFFLVFCIWGTLFCFWTFSTLLALNVQSGTRASSSNSATGLGIDAQEIVCIGLAGLFGLFAFMMALTHLSLIMTNRTTVEHMSMRTTKERENEVLGQLWSWWQVGAKRRTKKAWDQEWGRLETEGNLWWAGSVRRNWEEVMGRRWALWLLPLGPTQSGLEFPRNPRFDEYGRWRPRREWPDELR